MVKKLGKEWRGKILTDKFHHEEDPVIYVGEIIEKLGGTGRKAPQLVHKFKGMARLRGKEERIDYYWKFIYPYVNLIAPKGYEFNSIGNRKLAFIKIGDKIETVNGRFIFKVDDVLCGDGDITDYVIYMFRGMIPEELVEEYESIDEYFEREYFFYEEIVDYINDRAPEGSYFGLRSRYGYEWGFWSK